MHGRRKCARTERIMALECVNEKDSSSHIRTVTFLESLELFYSAVTRIFSNLGKCLAPEDHSANLSILCFEQKTVVYLTSIFSTS